MAQKKLALGSALGFIELIVTTIMGAIRAHGEEVLFSLSEDTVRDLTKKFVDSLVLASEASYRVLVDYGQMLKEMISAGKYYYANPDINPTNFPTQGSGQQNVVVELIHYRREMQVGAVLTDLESKGMRPATLPELLAFGATYPEKQREYPIVALGSVWRSNDYCLVAYLDGSDSERALHLDWGGNRWGVDGRFAAVRK